MNGLKDGEVYSKYKHTCSSLSLKGILLIFSSHLASPRSLPDFETWMRIQVFCLERDPGKYRECQSETGEEKLRELSRQFSLGVMRA